MASGLSEKTDQYPFYCLGTDTDDILTTTQISNKDRKQYSKVMEKVDQYFKVRQNVIFERAQFNRRN